MRRLAWFVGGVTLAATAAYVFIYLYRWEWHRALFVAVIFVATEVAMASALILRRLGRPADPSEGRPDRSDLDAGVVARIRDAAPNPDRFAWLRGDLSRTNVFITILLGGGAVVSAGAWVLDRLAARTVRPGLERALAERLGNLAAPEGGLVTSDAELVADEDRHSDDDAVRLLLGPTARRR